MKSNPIIKMIVAVSVGWLFVVNVSAGAQEPRTILFYGNSFTIGIGSAEAQSLGGVPGVFGQLAIAAGHPAPNVENAAVSGQTLTWHLANNTDVIANPVDFVPTPGFQWDHIVLQGFSTRPTHIGNLPQFRADLLGLFTLARNHSPNAGAVLFETWAREPGHSVYTGDPPSFPGGPAQMQQELRDGYELARQDVDAAFVAGVATVAPVGDAWESTNWDNLHATDMYHAGARGTYLTALVIFGTVYQSPTFGLPKVFPSFSEQEAAELQVTADLILGYSCGAAGLDCNSNCIPDLFEDDCNGNDVPDDCDIAAGTSIDCNTNGTPDECERVYLQVWGDDFDLDTSASWTTVAKDAGDTATFHFDYSTRSIPSAPRSVGGTTRGLMMEANTVAGPADASGICAYPIGQNFAGDFKLTWDMYISWDSGGSTEHVCAGINHGGTKLNASAEVGSDTDGVYVAAASDGDVAPGSTSLDGSIKDYNAYWGNNGAAPTRRALSQWDNGQSLFSGLFPSVTGDPVGASVTGSPGRQWVTGEIEQFDGVVTWRLDGEVIYEDANASGFDAGTIMLGFFDHFSGQNTTGNSFVIFDNVSVGVALDDVGATAECMSGPCFSPPCYPQGLGFDCCFADDDADGDVDLIDYQSLQLQTEPAVAELSLAPSLLQFSLEAGANQDAQNMTASTSDASSAIVSLGAIDNDTLLPPTWLSIPATSPTGAPFAVTVDAAALSVGMYSASITATSAGFVDALGSVELTVTPAASDSTVLIDFGSSASQTLGEALYWNNVHASNFTSTIGLRNVADVDTGITLEMSPTLRFNGSNTSGTTSPAGGSDLALRNYPAAATQDSLFGNDVTFSGGVYPTAQLTLTGLNPAVTYDFVFCASRLGVGDNRTTDYQVSGAATTTVSLDAAGNDSQIVSATGIAPNVQNEIVITVTKGAANNNSTGFYYLGTLELTETQP
jgi:hypothetical protein